MLLSVLLALTVIMLAARLVGAVLAKLNQPSVIGDVVMLSFNRT
jgi:Kef-type K+ transport system membrane component KefB